ncbi:MAG: redoxin domain-containing protein [Anaerolineae bacterium]|nr:redoxin domain-containing protein [Anaerolineae bacterium]
MTRHTSDAAKGEEQKGKVTSTIVGVAVVAFLLLLSYGLLSGPRSGPLNEGPAPDFSLQLFDGGQLSLADLRNQVIVVNFWGSWCEPCREEAPILEKVWQEYQGQGVTFIGIAYKDTEGKARAFLDEFDITYPNALDPGNRVARSYRVQGVPETFFIKDGEIADLYIGPLTEDQLVTRVERLLAR